MTRQSNVICFCMLAVLSFNIASTEGLTKDIKKPSGIRSINCYECESHVEGSDVSRRNKECEESTLPKKYLQTRDTGLEKAAIEKDASIVCQTYLEVSWSEDSQGWDYSLYRCLLTERNYGSPSLNFSLPSKPGDKYRCFNIDSGGTAGYLTLLSKGQTVLLDCACITNECNTFSLDQLFKELATATYVEHKKGK